MPVIEEIDREANLKAWVVQGNKSEIANYIATTENPYSNLFKIFYYYHLLDNAITCYKNIAEPKKEDKILYSMALQEKFPVIFSGNKILFSPEGLLLTITDAPIIANIAEIETELKSHYYELINEGLNIPARNLVIFMLDAPLTNNIVKKELFLHALNNLNDEQKVQLEIHALQKMQKHEFADLPKEFIAEITQYKILGVKKLDYLVEALRSDEYDVKNFGFSRFNQIALYKALNDSAADLDYGPVMSLLGDEPPVGMYS